MNICHHEVLWVLQISNKNFLATCKHFKWSAITRTVINLSNTELVITEFTDVNWPQIHVQQLEFAGWSHRHILLFTIRREYRESRDPLQSVSGIFPRRPSTGCDRLLTNIHWLHAVRWLADRMCRPRHADNYKLCRQQITQISFNWTVSYPEYRLLLLQDSHRSWSRGIKLLRFPGLESPGKRHILDNPGKVWNSKAVVLEILISGLSNR